MKSSATQETAPKTDDEKRERIRRQCDAEAAIRVADQVMDILGKPPRFHQVRGHYLFANAFRINVLADLDSPNGGVGQYMTDSFFVRVDTTTDKNGDKFDVIIESQPKLGRKYQ